MMNSAPAMARPQPIRLTSSGPRQRNAPKPTTTNRPASTSRRFRSRIFRSNCRTSRTNPSIEVRSSVASAGRKSLPDQTDRRANTVTNVPTLPPSTLNGARTHCGWIVASAAAEVLQSGVRSEPATLPPARWEEHRAKDGGRPREERERADAKCRRGESAPCVCLPRRGTGSTPRRQRCYGHLAGRARFRQNAEGDSDAPLPSPASQGGQ